MVEKVENSTMVTLQKSKNRIMLLKIYDILHKEKEKMKSWKKMIAVAVSMALLVPAQLTGISDTARAAETKSLSVYGGWNETLYAEWNDTDAGEATVSYKLSSDTSYTTVAAEDADLIRQTDADTARADIPGLTAGTYDLMITTSEGEVYAASDITVKENDRSGYAHFNYTRGVGAYNDDGTLKENAIVLYVTNENKDTVQVPGYEEYATGIGYILNGNTELMEQIVADGHALAVRFIGTVEAPEGLTGYNSTVNGGTVGDNGNMAIIKMAKDVTLEGIGTDATIEGWGFSFYVGENYSNRESYEVRNLTFQNYPEDAIGFQGYMKDSKTLTTPIEHVWVHNNSFYPGYCANPAESDKAEGDGSCDFKRGQYYTMDYNYYYECHKTNLIGASDSNLQFFMTLHHNFYENCGSRSPLARQANIHIYNSYFKGNTSKTVDARANAYILSEANYYEDCKNAMLTQSGAVVKSYNDIVYNCLESNTAVVVTERAEEVSNSNYYPDFDTNSAIFYYDSENKASDVAYLTSAAQAKADCIAFSGVMKEHDQIVDSVEAASIIENEPEAAVILPYSINFTDKTASDYAGTKMMEAGISQFASNTVVTLDNIVYYPASKYTQSSTSIKLRSQGITFTVDEESKVTLTEPEGTGKYALVLYQEDGTALLSVEDGTDSIVISAGTYMIQSANNQKDAYISSLLIEATGEGTTVTPTPEPEQQPSDYPAGLENAVVMGSYQLNNTTVKQTSYQYANMLFDCRSVESAGIKLRAANSIQFRVDQTCELSIVTSGKGVELLTEDGNIIYNGETAQDVSYSNSGTFTVTLEEGIYTLKGYSSSSNSMISSMTFTAE